MRNALIGRVNSYNDKTTMFKMLLSYILTQEIRNMRQSIIFVFRVPVGIAGAVKGY